MEGWKTDKAAFIHIRTINATDLHTHCERQGLFTTHTDTHTNYTDRDLNLNPLCGIRVSLQS